MTTQREWPNAMRLHRDRAAEEVNTALARLNALLARVENAEFTRQGLERDLLDATRRLQVAMRHLEAAGAQTVPE